MDTYYYGFNLNRPPFKDNPGLRRALSLVIDRERLTRQVLRVGELPAYGWIPPGVSNYTSQSFDYRNTPLTARIAEARRLYAQAGYSAAKPLRFELRYNAGEVHNKVAVVVASMWKEALGVEVVLTAVEFKSLLQDIDSGNVQMFRSSWLGDYNDAYTFAQYFKSNFGINLPHYRSAEYDSLIEQSRGRSRPDEAPGAAGIRRAGHAAGSSDDPDLLLRQQAPGQTGSAGLVRQRDECCVQQGPQSAHPALIRLRRAVSAPRSDRARSCRTSCECRAA